MALTVMKFGGSVLSSAEDLRHVALLLKQRIESNPKEKIVAVVSALKGLTDYLIDSAEIALKNETKNEERLKEIESIHLNILNEIEDEEIVSEIRERFTEKFKKLRRMLCGISYLKELSPRSRDFVFSRGETFSNLLLEAFLREINVKAKAFDSEEIGIITNGVYGNSNPNYDLTKKNLDKNLVPFIEENICIVSGYYGLSEKGEVTVFGRGGTDLTAGMLANCLNAGKLELWKDVDGLLTTDPRIVSNARIVKEISYDEAEELGYFGAKVLHPRTIIPLREKNIPAEIKNIKSNSKEKTIISGKGNGKEFIKSIAIDNNIALINIKSVDFVGVPGALSKIFREVSEKGISVDFVSTAETGISFSVKKNEAMKALNALKNLNFNIQNLNAEEDVALLGVVGAGIKNSIGFAGRLFTVLGKEKINVEAISQGSSELNISLIIKEKEINNAVKAIHKEFLEESK